MSGRGYSDPVTLRDLQRQLAEERAENARLRAEKSAEFDRGTEEARRQLTVAREEFTERMENFTRWHGEVLGQLGEADERNKAHQRTIDKRDREIEVRAVELRQALGYPIDDRSTSWEPLLMVVKYLRSVSPTADAKELLQRGFDIAREHADVAATGYDCAAWIDWCIAEAELAKEMNK